MTYSHKDMMAYARNPLNRPSYVHPLSSDPATNCSRAEDALRRVRWHFAGQPMASDAEALDQALYVMRQALLVVEELRQRMERAEQ